MSDPTENDHPPRTILITGATSGVGLAAAHELARAGHTVFISGRDSPRARGAERAIRHAARDPRSVQLITADLAEMSQVRALAATVRERTGSLDVLINNAGALFTKRRTTADGFEATFALNHLAPFLLTAELIEPLTAAPAPRVITTASSMHSLGRLSLEDLQHTRLFVPPLVYAASKQANVLFTRELARRFSDRLSAQCFHPGVVRSGFGKTDAWYVALVWRALGPLLRSPQRGARQLVSLADEDLPMPVNGAYWFDGKIREPAPRARDDALAAGLWVRSAELLELPIETRARTPSAT